MVPADSASLPDWVIPDEYKENRVDEVRFTLTETVLYKNLLTVMDLVANSNWERPIYWSTTVSSDNYLNLDKYFLREGMALRLAPVEAPNGYGLDSPWR